jgi:hypothetical protein
LAVPKPFKRRRASLENLFRGRRNGFPLLVFSQFRQRRLNDLPKPPRYNGPDFTMGTAMINGHVMLRNEHAQQRSA